MPRSCREKREGVERRRKYRAESCRSVSKDVCKLIIRSLWLPLYSSIRIRFSTQKPWLWWWGERLRTNSLCQWSAGDYRTSLGHGRVGSYPGELGWQRDRYSSLQNMQGKKTASFLSWQHASGEAFLRSVVLNKLIKGGVKKKALPYYSQSAGVGRQV